MGNHHISHTIFKCSFHHLHAFLWIKQISRFSFVLAIDLAPRSIQIFNLYDDLHIELGNHHVYSHHLLNVHCRFYKYVFRIAQISQFFVYINSWILPRSMQKKVLKKLYEDLHNELENHLIYSDHSLNVISHSRVLL